jgi:hypothetical protein
MDAMDTERGSGGQPRQEREELDLEHMRERELEEVLVSLMVVKYPGIEQEDIDRFLLALDAGNIDQVGQVEADIAFKSAQWKLAALDMDNGT